MNKAKIYLYSSPSEENYSLITEGEVSRLGDSITMSYSDTSGNTIIGISKGIVSLITNGELSYTLTLEENVPHPLEINTQFGPIQATLIPLKVSIKDSTDKIDVNLKYQIFSNNNLIIANTIKIKCVIEEQAL